MPANGTAGRQGLVNQAPLPIVNQRIRLPYSLVWPARRIFMRRLCGPLSDCSRPAKGGWLLFVTILLGFAATLTAQPAAYADILKAHDFLMAGDATRTRIVMQLDDNASFKWFLLRSPHRLVVDLPQTSFAIVPADLKPRG
jgi:hypothetical protein